MKTLLTHAFVFILNLYALTFFASLLLITYTIFIAPLPPWLFIALLPLLSLMCLLYQQYRNRFAYQSIGEHSISNTNKNDILDQSKKFSITRVPLFLLVILTLSLTVHLIDGLGIGYAFGFGGLLFRGVLFGSLYYGIYSFFDRPSLSPIALITIGLITTGAAYKLSPTALLTGELMFLLYISFAILWFLMGLLYKSRLYPAYRDI